MAFRSILVHVDEAPRVAERIRLAVELALQDDGHLLGVAMTGVARALYQNAVVDESFRIAWLANGCCCRRTRFPSDLPAKAGGRNPQGLQEPG